MAWKLSARSRRELENVHEDLQWFVRRLLVVSPVDFGVHDGIRLISEQRELVRRGVSRTMKSRHLDGCAVDLVPYINGKLRWEWAPIYELAAAARMVSIEIEIPIRWGGVWDRRLSSMYGTIEGEVEAYTKRRQAKGQRVFLDGPHFELPRSKRYP